MSVTRRQARKPRHVPYPETLKYWNPKHLTEGTAPINGPVELHPGYREMCAECIETSSRMRRDGKSKGSN